MNSNSANKPLDLDCGLLEMFSIFDDASLCNAISKCMMSDADSGRSVEGSDDEAVIKCCWETFHFLLGEGVESFLSAPSSNQVEFATSLRAIGMNRLGMLFQSLLDASSANESDQGSGQESQVVADLAVRISRLDKELLRQEARFQSALGVFVRERRHAFEYLRPSIIREHNRSVARPRGA